MFFHRDDAVAHRLSLSGDRPLAKKGVTSSYLGEYLWGSGADEWSPQPKWKTVDRPEAWRSAPRVALAVSMPPYTA